MPNSRSMLSSSSLVAVGGSVALGETGASYSNVYSLEFDGTDEYGVNTSPPSDFQNCGTDENVSVSAWVKTDDDGNNKWVLSAGTLASPVNISSFTIGKRHSNAAFFSVGAIWYAHIAYGAAINDGNWHHIAGTYNGSTITCYVDGTAGTGVSDTEAVAAAGLVAVGATPSTTGSTLTGHWDGSIDEVAVWSSYLSAADITAIYNSGAPTDLTQSDSYDTDRSGDLVLYLRNGDGDEDGTGSTVYDASGLDNDLVLINMENGDYKSDVPS